METSSTSIRTDRKAVTGLALILIPVILSCVVCVAMFFPPLINYGQAWMAFWILWFYIYPIPGAIGFLISYKSLREIEKSDGKEQKLAKTGRIIGAISVILLAWAIPGLLCTLSNIIKDFIK